MAGTNKRTILLSRNLCRETDWLLSIAYIFGQVAVSLPPSDVILAQIACPLSDVMFCLNSGITDLSLYKHYFLGIIKPGSSNTWIRTIDI
jgi:hypothetical protein